MTNISPSFEIINTYNTFSFIKFYLVTLQGFITRNFARFVRVTGNDAHRNLDRFTVLPECKRSSLVASRFQAERMAKLKLLSPLID